MDNKGTYAKVKSIVLNLLKKQDFDKNAEGKAILTDQDKALLAQSATFSDEFIRSFEVSLGVQAEYEAQIASQQTVMDSIQATTRDQLAEMSEKVNAALSQADALKAEKQKLEEANATLSQAVEVLSQQPEDDKPAERIVAIAPDQAKPWLGIKANRRHFHNQMAFEALQGNTAKVMQAASGSWGNSQIAGATGNTINVDEVYQEFGTYLSQTGTRLDILLKLTEKTEAQQYMTTKQAITEWRAATALITSVVQQFVAKWTPLGSSKFTPLTIKNYRHKVNLPITPDDINDSWLSYLYDEQVTPDQMPVTRFIIEKLLRPMIERDIEMLLIATGKYEALGTVTEGDAGQATGKSMDGFWTILQAQKALPTTAMNFFTPSVALTDDSIVDVIEEYSDWLENLAPLYAKSGMNIFIDPVLYKKFKRRYREMYPTTKNEDSTKNSPDFSTLTFVELQSLRGTGGFFSTPKENFIRLVHKNAAGGETKLFMQLENYSVKVFAEFWLGVGFAIGELVFAYVPETAGSSSGA